ncbi:hypothetical protein COCNU_contig69299735G000010 [Cocos nucifera]|nr:hypothetical protein [Cocos nucifera]
MRGVWNMTAAALLRSLERNAREFKSVSKGRDDLWRGMWNLASSQISFLMAIEVMNASNPYMAYVKSVFEPFRYLLSAPNSPTVFCFYPYLLFDVPAPTWKYSRF